MNGWLSSGMVDAIPEQQTITGRQKIHAKAFCLGGTLLSIAPKNYGMTVWNQDA
jgi:poly(3-hydroxyalkanoate) synthetase